jgi:hypothetical protein
MFPYLVPVNVEMHRTLSVDIAAGLMCESAVLLRPGRSAAVDITDTYARAKKKCNVEFRGYKIGQCYEKVSPCLVYVWVLF